MAIWKWQVWLEFFFSNFYISFIECKFTSNQNCITFDWIEWTTLQIRNENPLGCLFYLYNFTLNSSVKNLVSRCAYLNAKHRKNSGYMKMDIYLGIRLLGEEIFLRQNIHDIFYYRT